MSEPTTIHRLKIGLRDLKPPVWRRLEVASDATLAELHEVIQTAFMWFDCHLHEFDVDGTIYGIDDGEGEGEPPIDESTARLGDLVGAGMRFHYTYDFGDNWRHLVEIEAVEGPEAGVGYPRCTDGRRSAPPEDVGGPDGFAYFVESVTDPQHPDHKDQVAWHGREDFDPDYFEVESVNEALRVT